MGLKGVIMDGDDGRILVLLDTNTVRDLVEAPADKQDAACRTLRLGLRSIKVSIPDGTALELIGQLHRGEISFENWRQTAALLETVLQPGLPIINPGDVQPLPTIMKRKAPPDALDPRRMAAMWALLSSARSSSDLSRGLSFTNADGSVRHDISLEHAKAMEVAASLAVNWQGLVGEVAAGLQRARGARTDGKRGWSEGDLFKSTMEELVRLKALNPATFRIRLDGYVRSQVRFFYLSQQGGRGNAPYNPKGKNRAGDPLDQRLLLALAIPAVICTSERRLRSHLELTKSPQAGQLCNLDELLKDIASGALRARVAWCAENEPPVAPNP